MNRKKQILIELIVLSVLILVFLKFHSFYLSGESFLHANETGLHYGPSKEVLLKHRNGTNVLMVGRIDHRTLSVIQGKKRGPFYYLRGGGITGQLSIHLEEESAIAVLSRTDDIFFGIADKERYPKCTKVRCFYEIRNNETQGEEIFLDADVQINGFFVKTGLSWIKWPEDGWSNLLNIEGYDTDGNLLFKNY